MSRKKVSANDLQAKQINPAEFQLLAGLNLEQRRAKTWDANLWRGPRVMTPVHLEALVVEEEGGTWADLRFRSEEIPPDGAVQKDLLPPPFTDLPAPRPRGVHLHWTLPDGLTRGEQKGADDAEAELSEELLAAGEQHEVLDEETVFPKVPDRWLVMRVYPGRQSNRRNRRGWVIEAEKGKVTPLEEWRPPTGEEVEENWLTALGEGDPAWAATYDNVRNRFAFHDPLEDVSDGPLSYLVTGWYSNIDDDPLNLDAGSSETEWLEKLSVLGWEIEQALQGARNAQKATAERMNTVGLDAVTSKESGQALNLGKQFFNAGPVAQQPGDVSISAVAPSAQQTSSLGTGKVELQSEMSQLHASSRANFVMTTGDWWPRQILCHGSVVGVKWGLGGGAYDSPGSGPPPAASMVVAVGNTSVAALAALVAKNVDRQTTARVLEAFHYGILSELDEQDGLALLEEKLHSQTFKGIPAGYTVEEILQTELENKKNFPRAEASYQVRKQFVTAGPQGVGQQPVFGVSPTEKLAFGQLTLAEAAFETTPRQETQEVKRLVRVRRALPRFYQAVDPVILLNRTRRALVHGFDGRFNEANKLVCRLTGQAVQQISARFVPMFATGDEKLSVAGDDLIDAGIQHGGVPDECEELLREVLLSDPDIAPLAAERALENIGRSAEEFTPEQIQELQTGFQVNQTAPLLATSPGFDRVNITNHTDAKGTVQSLLGLRFWSRPWIPLHLEWEVEYIASPNGVKDWALGELDFRPLDDTALINEDSKVITYRGRTLLVPSPALTLADRTRVFIQEEQRLDSQKNGVLTPLQEQQLSRVRDELEKLDILAASLGGLHELLLGNEELHQVVPEDLEGTEPLIGAPENDLPVVPIRAGVLRVKRLRVVDAFGQVVEIPAESLQALERSEPLSVDDGGDLIAMPPVLVPPARLQFRFVSSEDDAVDSTRAVSPVCGWLLPDHLDHALEVLDDSGNSLGQVYRTPDGGLDWEGAPGLPGPAGQAPAATIENRTLATAITRLIEWGISDERAIKDGEPRDESALSAMLRAIDTTLWTIDPLGEQGDEHLSLLLGRPLAVVRARLTLEFKLEEVPPDMLQTVFEVRLGSLTHFDDGLLGYFVNDDFATFHPVDKSIVTEARASGPQTGFLDTISSVPQHYQNFGENKQPITHPYIHPDPTVEIRPAQTIFVTLIVDPRGGIHASSGILPRKRISLLRDHLSGALEKMAPTFSIGPVLVDPTTIRMPIPTELQGDWKWTRRDTPTTWQEDLITQATKDAHLPDEIPTFNEGWLKLFGGLGPNEQEGE